jgi:hypothetical protein
MRIIDADFGESIYQAVQRVLAEPRWDRVSEVMLNFNGYHIRVYPESCEEDLIEKYSTALQIQKLNEAVLALQRSR